MSRLPRILLLLVIPLILALSLLIPEPRPTPNFGTVVRGGIYRGSQPDEKALVQLKAMGIKTILKINTRGLKEERRAAKRAGLDFIHIPTKAESIADAESCEDVEQIMAVLNDESKWPVYVHCEYGRDRTGYAVGLYRLRVQNWPWGKINRELKYYGHTRSKRESYPDITRSLKSGAKGCE